MQRGGGKGENTYKYLILRYFLFIFELVIFVLVFLHQFGKLNFHYYEGIMCLSARVVTANVYV